MIRAVVEDFLKSRIQLTEVGRRGALEWLRGKRAGGSTGKQIVGQVPLAGEGGRMERRDANRIGGIDRGPRLKEQASHVGISGLGGDVQRSPPFLK